MPSNRFRVAPLLPVLFAVLFTLGGCASAPSEPDVLALPGTGKSLEQFGTDDVSCRQHASGQLAAKVPDPSGTTDRSWYDRQKRYDFAYVQCMYARGHRVPVIGRNY